MKIEIKLFASLKKLLPPQADGSTATPEVEDGLTVAGLLGQLQVPKELAQLVLVNGVNIEGEYSRTLGEGDTVSVFPPVAGGIAYPYFPDLDNAPEKEVAPGIKLRAAWGDKSCSAASSSSQDLKSRCIRIPTNRRGLSSKASSTSRSALTPGE